MEKFNQIIQSIQGWFYGLTAEQKRRFALVCTIIFAGLLTLSVFTSMRRAPKTEIIDMPERLDIISPIPATELFLPDEPDYIPGVLLEREQRSSWTEQDASEHWQDPLRLGEEQWREKIEAAINEFMESVP